MKRITFIVAVVGLALSVALVSAASPQLSSIREQQISGQDQLKKFSSYEELEDFVVANLEIVGHYYDSIDFSPVSMPVPLSFGRAEGIGKEDSFSADFSTTNIQVEGVDEADIVKNDGKYIYVVSGNRVTIIDAYPAESAKILSEIEENGNPTEIFINGDKLVVFGWTFVKVYDVSCKEEPILKRDVSFDGSYFDSRMIGDYVYVIIISSPIYYPYTWEESEDSYVGIKYRTPEVKFEITLPEISINGNVRTIQATEIYYFDVPDYSYEFTTIMAINTQDDDEEITTETILMGTAHDIFVSPNNIYITYTNSWYVPLVDGDENWTEKTAIHKIAIANGEIEYKSQGEVPGCVLNQFSMDEYQGYFRIATTTGWSDQNHVYILDGDLNIAGKLEGLAPGERIYSARFMGGRAYLVTFRQVDPLFVLDLSDPRDPKVLGKLKIPGYSDYLHPYDETHIIGVGRETGVKIALFDVSDPENPREISKYEVGNWSIDSYALDDHGAFLFSRSKNLLVMPIGYYSRQEAHVFNVSLEDGIVLKGTIAHVGSDENWPYKSHDAFTCVYPWYYRDYSVKRSLYIDNVLYTISDGLVKMNDLKDLNEINKIELHPTDGDWLEPLPVRISILPE
jgi:uncharacterized secreted protein with C-terminal beta-propeller domain